MANNQSRFRNIKMINSTLNTINGLMNGIYKSTYNSDRNSMNSVNQVTQDIEDNIASIISKNNISDINNVGKIYTRMKLSDLSQDKEFRSGLETIFEDPSLSANILSMYTENRWVKELDMEYEAILQYMPRLKEALQAKKENVLSSDNFNKDFLNENSNNINNPSEQAIFSSRLQSLKERYKLQEFYEETYDNVALYGEEFIYCVPYSKELTTLLNRKPNTMVNVAKRAGNTYGKMLESGSQVIEIPVIENNIITDNELFEKCDKIAKLDKLTLPKNLTVTFDTRGLLESAYQEQVVIESNLEKLPGSIYESVLEAGGTKKVKLDNTVPDELELPKNFDKTSNDGFINQTKTENVKIPGMILRRLKHENVIPLYIDTTCLGYYYIEFLAGASYDVFSMNDRIQSRDTIGFTGVQPQGRNVGAEAIEDQRNNLLAYLAGNIARNIDSKFIKNNHDITEEIYTILKFNDVFNGRSVDNIRITFLPTEDVEHIFFKQDPVTHRGISDLYYSLIPAKLYACLYITNTLGILTRGNDKRVYYVKQNVEQNIAGTMLNVINQIKRGNFGMREIQNMNSILNITGRFSDYVIPVGPSGDPPIQFEVMQGQEFNPNTELLDRLEEMAINPTDIPIEYIQNRMQSLDFAIQATTVNAKMLRSTYRRQAKFEYYLSRIQTKLYNAEYDENIKINCTLPTPLFLHMTNINQMIENTKNYVQSIADYEYEATSTTDKDNDAKKAIFIKNMMRKKITAYLKIDEIDEMKRLSELEFENEKSSGEE